MDFQACLNEKMKWSHHNDEPEVLCISDLKVSGEESKRKGRTSEIIFFDLVLSVASQLVSSLHIPPILIGSYYTVEKIMR